MKVILKEDFKDFIKDKEYNAVNLCKEDKHFYVQHPINFSYIPVLKSICEVV